MAAQRNKPAATTHSLPRASVAALGNRMRLARLRSSLTLAEVATAAGMTTGHLSRIERGEKLPSIGAILRLAQALDVAAGELLGGSPSAGELVISRAGERSRLGLGARADAFRYDMILSEAVCAGQTVTVVINTADPEAGGVESSCDKGVELVFVMTGMIEVVFEGSSVKLKAGDALLFPGYLRHRLRRCQPDDTASALVVMVGG